MSFVERRKAKRVEAELAIKISGGGGEAEGRTIDISSNGVSFESPRLIDPLTKVRLEMAVPFPAGEGERRILFDGVVVRTEPEVEDPSVALYRIAVFFTYMDAESQHTLDEYIESMLSA